MINDKIKEALAELFANDSAMYSYCKDALNFSLKVYGGRISRAAIQRELKTGFNQACRIMDALQKLELVEEDTPDQRRPLRALITMDEFCELFPDAA